LLELTAVAVVSRLHARIEVLGRQAHIAHLTDPQDFAETVLSFPYD